MNLLILCALFFTGCKGEKKESQDLHAMTLLQDAAYFQREGEESLAKQKARLAFSHAKTTQMKAEIELFLTGDSSLIDDLEEGYKKRILLGDRFFKAQNFKTALSSYEKALAYMEATLSELYQGRTTINPKSLAVYKQRIAMRYVQLKIAQCLDDLGKEAESWAMLQRVTLEKSWKDVQAKWQKLAGKPLDITLYEHDHIGHTAAQFAHMSESDERYLLKSCLELAAKKGSFQ